MEKSVDVNAVGGRHGNALDDAISSEDEAMVRFLLDKGADVNARPATPGGACYATALSTAAERGNEALVKLLLGEGAICDQLALHRAMYNDHEDVVQLLIQNGANTFGVREEVNWQKAAAAMM